MNRPIRGETKPVVQKILGYLNFSSGLRDTGFLEALSDLYALLAQTHSENTWKQVPVTLAAELAVLNQTSGSFKDVGQATRVLSVVYDKLLPAYREFHRDLLFHQTDDFLFSPFFIGHAFEVVLSQELPWPEDNVFLEQVIRTLNDYIGYRPVPVLEGRDKNEADPHEWVAPIPLYIEGAGVAFGRYQLLIEKCLEILQMTDPAILRDACFDPAHMRELVIDPRAYDFDHPVNRRPNHHFGMWDSHTIDENGYFRRFVVHSLTLDGILQRLESAYTGESEVSHVPYEELLYEAGAILAGTMLMGAGISGDHTHTFDSNMTLMTLMPHIASYRDRFYESLMTRIPETMHPRMEQERKRLHQPFGGARQSLNKQLAKQRADQLQRFHLARTLARMGYFEAANRQADIIAVVSARILCKMDCYITEGHLLIDQEKPEQAGEVLPKIENLLHRGVACGAIADPWTILGFGAQFSLFPAVDNTVHDHRIDDLINLLNDIFDLACRLQKEAAASGLENLQTEVSNQLAQLAGWWDQFGSMDVSGVEGFSGQAVWESSNMVANALAAWHKAGTAAGDIQFWSRHVERFESPKAYVMLGEALLDQRDLVAAMALMMHWLNQSDRIPLTEGDFSFHSLIMRWIELVWKQEPKKVSVDASQKLSAPLEPAKRWEMTKKLFDFLEANAGEYWNIPVFEIEADGNMAGHDAGPSSEEGHRGIDDTYSAAYENVTYHDTAEDGVDEDIAEGNGFEGSSRFNDDDDFELFKETDRISDRLAFLITMSKLWRYSATKSPRITGGAGGNEAECETLIEWLKQAAGFQRGLEKLLASVTSYEVPPPKGTQDSLMEYDKHRGTKEILLDRIVWTIVEVLDSICTIFSVLGTEVPAEMLNMLRGWQKTVLPVFSAAYRGEVKTVKKLWPEMMTELLNETLLYVPTSRGGSPMNIVAVRFLQQTIIRLFEYGPRLGLIAETVELLHTVEQMEQLHPLKQGAITEYDRLFEKATRAIARCVSESSKKWRVKKEEPTPTVSHALADYMEQIIEILLAGWLSHSKQIRISPVESIADKRVWEGMKGFIQKYGHDIFTQNFMAFGNLRAVLHQGTKNYLQSLIQIYKEEGELETAQILIEDLISSTITMDEAVYNLDVIFESIAENYSEYIDYNSTTIHSDRGERLYMLLDMLRVLTGYERISWNLKPVYWVHDEMIRAQRQDAAEIWERAVAKRSIQAAEEHLKHYMRLSEKYGMWLPSVHERLQERFVRPLQIDRMCGIVPEAVREARDGTSPKKAFLKLEEQIELFAREPMGVGYEVPMWLSSLQDEVLTTRLDESEESKTEDVYNLPPLIPQIRLSRAELNRQIKHCVNNPGLTL
ncbi:MAG: hypothetical protein LBQ54_07470 [Planctomycetaceae bacterium]|jgi:hypothetical protein|nr:hypothetical protein [Planctomycetaceae bacterium]